MKILGSNQENIATCKPRENTRGLFYDMLES
jgi:hypothetical protein